MSGGMLAWVAFGILCLLASLGYGLWRGRQTEKDIARISSMLDLAIDGAFTENTFDETTLSALEAKLNRYLSRAAISAKNLEEEKANIETLISDISHQTKTPIANILLYSQLLAEEDLSAECREQVAALTSQAEKLSFLIGALVKTSRLETGLIAVAPQTNALAPLLTAVLEESLPKAKKKEIVLDCVSCEVFAVFDSKWTAEALCNIVDNAIKYTPQGGRVTLSVTSYELFCRIDVADNGIGISEGEQAAIFGRFYRSPKVNREEGVGIGLFLAREIISAQGGYIKVRSEEGQGAVFSVFLPKSGA